MFYLAVNQQTSDQTNQPKQESFCDKPDTHQEVTISKNAACRRFEATTTGEDLQGTVYLQRWLLSERHEIRGNLQEHMYCLFNMDSGVQLQAKCEISFTQRLFLKIASGKGKIMVILRRVKMEVFFELINMILFVY